MKAFRYTIEEKGKTKVLTSTGQQRGATFDIRRHSTSRWPHRRHFHSHSSQRKI